MDLPTCPACGQSVLDDDADECPFCGASMSGKPVATKPAPAKTAAPKSQPAAPSKPASVRRPEHAPAPSEEKISSDDPFELERSADARKKVVQLRAKPEPGRRHEVKCPMCETVGYTGTKAAGMDVKCANPDCKFPYFAAPPLDEPEEGAAEKPADTGDREPRKKLSELQKRIIVYSLIGVVSLFALWFFAFRKPSRPKPSGNGPVTNPFVDVNRKTEPDVPINKDKSPKKDKGTDILAEMLDLRKRALRLMIDHSGQTGSPILKPLAWQWTVDAHARAGDLTGAAEQLGPLRNVTLTGRFYESLPLVEMAWKRMDRSTPDDDKAAKQHLDDALAAAKVLPQRSRQRYDIAAELSAALLAAGRDKDATVLLADNGDADDASLASLFAYRVRLLESFDAEAALRNRGIDAPTSPPRVVITWILAGHGRWKQAWDWAKTQPAGSVRDDCLIAWSEMRITHVRSDRLQPVDGKQPKKKDPNALPTLVVVAAELSDATARGTLFARAALRFHDRKQNAEANAALAKARDALKGVQAESEPKTPAVRDVSTFIVMSDAEIQNRRAAAAALAELARAELRLDPKTGKGAWTAMTRSLNVARSIAPSPADTARMVVAVQVRNERAVRAELARLTSLEGDQLDKLFKDYRTNVLKIDAAAKARFAIATRLLMAAVNWGAYAKSRSPEFLKQIWKDVDARSAAKSGGREDWFATRIPWLLAGSAEMAGDSALATEVRGKIGRLRPPSQQQYVWDQFQAALRNKDYKTAAAAISAPRLSPNWVYETVLLHVTRFADAGELKSGVEFIRALKDPIQKMDAMFLLAARATLLGKVKDIWELTQDQAVDSPQKVALCHGLLTTLRIPAKPAGKKP